MGNNSGAKKCPVCKKDFLDLKLFMEHIKKEHRNISPDKILEMGKETRWSFRN
jgi:uncharacterized C2H2 Zn-finger protein